MTQGQGDETTHDQDAVPAPKAGASRHPDDARAVEQLHGLVHYVVENLVEEPGSATIDVDQRGNVVAFSVRLPEEELGKVIGRGGRIAKSIRTALMIAGSQHHLRVSLDIDALHEDAEPEPAT